MSLHDARLVEGELLGTDCAQRDGVVEAAWNVRVPHCTDRCNFTDPALLLLLLLLLLRGRCRCLCPLQQSQRPRLTATLDPKLRLKVHQR